MSWPSSNSFNAVRTWVESRLAAVFDPREAQNITRILCEEVSKRSRAQLLVRDYKFSESELNKLNDASSELVNGRPLQHVLGFGNFLDFSFRVTKDTLAPRPETEELVMLAAKTLPQGATVLDLGTGTGCIAISLKVLRPDLQISACDISEPALRVAQANAQSMNVAVHFFQMDMLTETPQEQFDAFISNPPYIPQSEKGAMDQRVVKYEPEMALFVDDETPLLFYDRMLQLAQTQLHQAEMIFFECHEHFASSVFERCQIFFENVRLERDLQAKNRMVFASQRRDIHSKTA